jgi:hypothetical protein
MNFQRSIYFLLAAMAGLSVWAGCKDDAETPASSSDAGDEHDSLGPTCAALKAACHEADDKENGQNQAVTDCHETAHKADETVCGQIKDDCTALCDAVMADAGAAGGH